MANRIWEWWIGGSSFWGCTRSFGEVACFRHKGLLHPSSPLPSLLPFHVFEFMISVFLSSQILCALQCFLCSNCTESCHIYVYLNSHQYSCICDTNMWERTHKCKLSSFLWSIIWLPLFYKYDHSTGCLLKLRTFWKGIDCSYSNYPIFGVITSPWRGKGIFRSLPEMCVMSWLWNLNTNSKRVTQSKLWLLSFS